jgi:hypothetical protein
MSPLKRVRYWLASRLLGRAYVLMAVKPQAGATYVIPVPTP